MLKDMLEHHALARETHGVFIYVLTCTSIFIFIYVYGKRMYIYIHVCFMFFSEMKVDMYSKHKHSTYMET